jgi:hypothetical protein
VLHHTVKPVLKRGALVAAANWQVIVVQAVADALFKVLIAMPLIGGIFLVALVVGAEPGTLMSLGWRELAATIVASLMSRPVVLVAFLASLAIVVAGGSLFVFLVKAGTVATLVDSERAAGPIERPPLRYTAVVRTAAFSIERFESHARALFPRYARLGVMLMALYLLSGAAYLAAVVATRSGGSSWGVTALVTGGFVAWITIVNLVYLLMQIVLAAEACSVAAAWGHVGTFVRRQRRQVTVVFLVVLVIVVFAQGASLLATTALGLIGFVPLVGLTVLPLQLVAWLFRALVFQYIGLASIGAYATLYRDMAEARTAAPAGAPVLGRGVSP